MPEAPLPRPRSYSLITVQGGHLYDVALCAAVLLVIGCAILSAAYYSCLTQRRSS